MRRSLDDKYTERELKIQESIDRAKRNLCFLPEEMEDLRRVYKKVAETKRIENVFNRIQDSKTSLKEFELWKKFQNVVMKNNNHNINYQEFVGRVLNLDESEWEDYWKTGKERSVPR